MPDLEPVNAFPTTSKVVCQMSRADPESFPLRRENRRIGIAVRDAEEKSGE